MHDTIAAISTPFGEGAIAMIRMSGPQAIAIVEPLFRAKKRAVELPSHLQQFGRIFDGGDKVDDVLLSIHRGPHSYTGEDVVEISGHGGILVARRILEALLKNGARAANPGEFTQRAYLNGRMDLTQAEAVMDLISAQTDLALRAAHEQLEGRLGIVIRSIREELVSILAHVEAFIDFPEEDIDPHTGARLLERIAQVRAEVQRLQTTAAQGRVLREGLRTVIYGAPNVGKSSLLNLLLGYERAIVSDRPGTTRDVIEEVINLRGIPLRLIDTAGVRNGADVVEQLGMERTRREVERAGMVLHLFAADEPPPTRLDGPAANEIVVLNKIDLSEHPAWNGVGAVRISCLARTGLEQLEQTIVDRVFGGGVERDWALAINARHNACLDTALNFLQAAESALQSGALPEIIAEELRSALDAVGDIVGHVDSEELLGTIFNTFCIGK